MKKPAHFIYPSSFTGRPWITLTPDPPKENWQRAPKAKSRVANQPLPPLTLCPWPVSSHSVLPETLLPGLLGTLPIVLFPLRPSFSASFIYIQPPRC